MSTPWRSRSPSSASCCPTCRSCRSPCRPITGRWTWARGSQRRKADGRRVAVVASSDLTHYGSRYGFAPAGGGEAGLAWSKDNDGRLVERALEFDAPGVLEEAATRHSACGAGALAAAISATRALGASDATLLHQTTSWEVRPIGAMDLTVGYASILFA